MILTPDLVGFTDNRVYKSTPGASVTRTTIVDDLVNSMTAAGWTKLSGPTATTHGDEYEFISQQSPWYDTTNIPSWYVGGRAYFKIVHPNSTSIGFDVGEYYNGTAFPTATTLFFYNPLAWVNNLYDFRLLVNSYEIWMWGNASVAATNTTFYLGALNVPKPELQRNKVISSIFATEIGNAGTLIGSDIQYSCWRTVDGGALSLEGNPGSTNRSQYLTVVSPSGGTYGAANGRMMWVRGDDLNMTDIAKWQPYDIPAQIAIYDGTNYLFRGFQWDCFVRADAYLRGSVIELINKTWVNVAGDTTAAVNGCALFLNTGVAGMTL